jgi:hypothetical protein
MEAITPPNELFDAPPTGVLPDHCPSCNAYLGMFLAKSPDVGPVLTERPAVLPAMPPLPELIGELASQKPAEPAQNTVNGVFDHPAIGGEIALCVLLFGNDNKIHRRCLQGIAQTTGLERLAIKVIYNGTKPQSVPHCGLKPRRIYVYGRPHSKFELMRHVFQEDKTQPRMKWNVWIDDITFCRSKDWLVRLAETIIEQDPAERVGALATKFCHQLTNSQGKDPRDWFRQAAWFRGVDFQNKTEGTSPNGDCIHYPSPNFFAISTEAILACDIPDSRIKQRGGGVTIGEQLHQNGFKIKSFSQDYVRIEQLRSRMTQELPPWQ